MGHLQTLLARREETNLESAKKTLDIYKNHYQNVKEQIKTYEEQIAAALVIINRITDENVKFLIKQAIAELERDLSNEQYDNLIIKKYGALANMLQTVVIDPSSSLNAKELAVNTFLTVFRSDPSTIAKQNAAIALNAAAWVLAIGISVVGSLAVEIPMIAGFIVLGLSIGGLIAATIAASLLLLFGLCALSNLCISKLYQTCLEPTQKLWEQTTNEYKQAKLINDHVRHCFFNAKAEDKEELAPIEDINKPEVSPLISIPH